MRLPTRFVWAAAAALAAGGPAQAFYWDGWPGSAVPRPRSLVPTDAAKLPPNPTADPTFPPGGESNPPGTPPGGPPGTVPNPEHVPEPTGGVAALVGLGVLAARRLRRG
ncbi:hypothetical protein [Urbifossiella limnaea]|uniref:PEP-CTERM sorting domain-containing protein n=1 Tax=Urbifossiella limnaea TaxID=2528023 RepID=A0A517XXI7_9BACT|nr:hypothetical protein [Urbifossiella limnaea]QDU22249.1 hypothetical protein ETAA1_42260 [Urbifossiella limnaea]